MSQTAPSAVIVYRVPFASVVQEEELERFDRELNDLSQRRPGGRFAIDFTATFHMSSRALGVLVAFYKRAQERHGRVVLFGTNPAVEKVMKVTKLDTLMPLMADEEQAFAELEADAG